MAFPTNPSNNDVHKEGNRAFVYDSTLGTWDQIRETDRGENKIFVEEIKSGPSDIFEAGGRVVGYKYNEWSHRTTCSGSTDNYTWANVTGSDTGLMTLKNKANKLLITATLNWAGAGGTNAAGKMRIIDIQNSNVPAWMNWDTDGVEDRYFWGAGYNYPNSQPDCRGEQINATFQYIPNQPSVNLRMQALSWIGGGHLQVNHSYDGAASATHGLPRSSIAVLEIQV